MAKSTLSIAVTQSKKSLSLTGLISIRETIDITVVDGGSLVADGLVLKIQAKGNRGLTTPIAFLSTWTVSGDDAIGTLNTNTTEAVAAFSSKGNLGCKVFNILLYTVDTTALMANDCISIKNFPSSVSTEPVTLSQCAEIAALDARLTTAEATLVDDVVLYNDFVSVSALGGSTTLKQAVAKINELLALLKG